MRSQHGENGRRNTSLKCATEQSLFFKSREEEFSILEMKIGDLMGDPVDLGLREIIYWVNFEVTERMVDEILV